MNISLIQYELHIYLTFSNLHSKFHIVAFIMFKILAKQTEKECQTEFNTVYTPFVYSSP